MRVLITGGFGYLGGRIAQSLVNQGYQVVLGSRREQSAPDWLPKIELARIDWNDESSLKISCKNIDVIIHAAGMNAKESAEDPVAALEFNGVATERLVRASVFAGVTKFIYLSTAHVYSSPLVGKIDEESCLTNKHPYATSHVAGENAVLWANREKQIRGIVLRLSNVTGAPVSKGVNCWMLLIHDLCKQAITKKELQLKSKKIEKRDFVSIKFVVDVIEGFVSDKIKSEYNIFNVGSGKTYSIDEIALIVKDRCEKIFKDTIDINNRACSMNNSREELSYIINRLNNDGVFVKDDICSEIDDILLFCNNNF